MAGGCTVTMATVMSCEGGLMDTLGDEMLLVRGAFPEWQFDIESAPTTDGSLNIIGRCLELKRQGLSRVVIAIPTQYPESPCAILCWDSSGLDAATRSAAAKEINTSLAAMVRLGCKRL